MLLALAVVKLLLILVVVLVAPLAPLAVELQVEVVVLVVLHRDGGASGTHCQWYSDSNSESLPVAGMVQRTMSFDAGTGRPLAFKFYKTSSS